MAVKLEEIYGKLYSKYGVRLCTESCFEKVISWMHILEDMEFVSLLRGGELILNSEYESEESLKQYIDLLNQANAGGLIIALRPGRTFAKEIVDYCNSIEFPLFSATWKNSYMDITHLVASMLLDNEQKEANRVNALRNAIRAPENTDAYLPYFEEMAFPGNSSYLIVLVGLHAYDVKNGGVKLEKSLRYSVSNSIIYEEKGVLIILVSGNSKKEIKQLFQDICEKDHHVCAGMGVVVDSICEVHQSYQTADTVYRLTRAGLNSFLDYDDLGVYKLLADVRNGAVYPAFVEETLGPLLRYDEENQTDYVQILQTYFENECSGVQTAKALYFHKNTLTFKLSKIRGILGYDILSNENRTKIMMSFYIIRMGKEYFTDRINP